MRRQFWHIPANYVALAILMANNAFLPAADESSVTEKEIQRLIEQLGSSRFREREQATQYLFEIGKPALPSLKEAAKSPDAEVRGRAQRLVERIDVPPVRPVERRVEQRTHPRSYL